MPLGITTLLSDAGRSTVSIHKDPWSPRTGQGVGDLSSQVKILRVVVEREGGRMGTGGGVKRDVILEDTTNYFSLEILFYDVQSVRVSILGYGEFLS